MPCALNVGMSETHPQTSADVTAKILISPIFMLKIVKKCLSQSHLHYHLISAAIASPPPSYETYLTVFGSIPYLKAGKTLIKWSIEPGADPPANVMILVFLIASSTSGNDLYGESFLQQLHRNHLLIVLMASFPYNQIDYCLPPY